MTHRLLRSPAGKDDFTSQSDDGRENLPPAVRGTQASELIARYTSHFSCCCSAYIRRFIYLHAQRACRNDESLIKYVLSRSLFFLLNMRVTTLAQ